MIVRPSLSGNITVCRLGWLETQVLNSCIATAKAVILLGSPYSSGGTANSFKSSVCKKEKERERVRVRVRVKERERKRER
jgi:hypothetical protein